MLSMIELNVIVEATGVKQKRVLVSLEKGNKQKKIITLGVDTVTTNSAFFSPPLKQGKALYCSLRIYVRMA